MELSGKGTIDRKKEMLIQSKGPLQDKKHCKAAVR